MRKLLIGVLLWSIFSVAFALDTQQIINPITGAGMWDLTQEDCGRDSSKGVIRENGKAIGCWWTNLTTEDKMANNVWFLVNGQIYSFPTSKINRDMQQYKTENGLPWQTLRDISNANRGNLPSYNPPPVNTYYYGAGGGYVGRSTSF